MPIRPRSNGCTYPQRAHNLTVKNLLRVDGPVEINETLRVSGEISAPNLHVMKFLLAVAIVGLFVLTWTFSLVCPMDHELDYSSLRCKACRDGKGSEGRRCVCPSGFVEEGAGHWSAS